ncbi:MAG: hypothetical protein IAI49_02090, partial [Candidatus Eremiobacteraeota bacterium]|nr:hypothetical protein [Candidatus Eremiobacteraeota bacterium]
MSWPHGDPNAVVARVLADPLYRSASRTTSQAPARSPLELAFAWLWEHAIRPLVHPIANALAATRGVGTTAGFVLVALALLGLGYLAFRLALALGRERTGGSRGGGSLRPLDRERSAVDWRGLARAAAARAEYGAAIAALFNAALAELDERAVVAFDAARTPGEYRRMVRRAR